MEFETSISRRNRLIFCSNLRIGLLRFFADRGLIQRQRGNMKKNAIRVGLIGAGVFGGYHANKLSQNGRVVFSGVFDPDSDRAGALAQKHEIQSFTEPKALLEQSQAIVVACPASYHGENAIQALENACHVLIEKPIATDFEQAQKIVSLSEQKSLIVQIGHQERFVAKAIGLHSVPETPTHIIAIRNTPYSIRGTDTSVTLDLMSHDIDLCCMLMKGTPTTVSGTSEAIKSKTPDQARAELTFDNCTAILSSSRVEDTLTRQMTLRYPSGTVLIDFATKTLQHNTPFNLNANFGNDAKAADSLGAATDCFIAAVLDGTPVSVTAQDGLNAAKIALQIDGVI